MIFKPLFFTAIGTVPQAHRLSFLTQDVRAAGTVLGFYGAAAAIGARPAEMALMVVRKYQPSDRERQIVMVFQQDAIFSGHLRRIYAARGRPLGFEAQNRWCAISEPNFLPQESFALLAARFKTLLLIEEAAGETSLLVFASQGFTDRPALKLAPLPRPAPAAKAESRPAAKPRKETPAVAARPIRAPTPVRAAAPLSLARLRPAALPLARKRRLRSVVALNPKVERQVIDEFRRLLQAVSYFG